MLLERRDLLENIAVKELVMKFIVFLSNTDLYIRDHIC